MLSKDILTVSIILMMCLLLIKIFKYYVEGMYEMVLCITGNDGSHELFYTVK